PPSSSARARRCSRWRGRAPATGVASPRGSLHEITIYEAAVPNYDRAALVAHRLPQPRPGVHEGVEFAVLAARIHSWRKVVQQVGVELPACKRAVELRGVHAHEHGAVPQPDKI